MNGFFKSVAENALFAAEFLLIIVAIFLAALALENRAEIRRWCGWRLGGRVCAFYQYVLDQDPGPLRRWDRVYRCYDTLRDAKSRLLYRR